MRIGLIGGTFDPIHYGHLIAAAEARHAFDLSKVIFVPAGRPVHKQGDSVSATVHRVAMVRLAVASNPHFEVSTVEIDRPGLSYAVDTIGSFCQYSPKERIYFVVGADAELGEWYQTEELLRLCWIVAVARPGHNLERLMERLVGVQEDLRRKILPLNIPGVDVSSTDIRQRVNAGRPIKYLLPEAVEEYIIRHKMYVGKTIDGTPGG